MRLEISILYLKGLDKRNIFQQYCLIYKTYEKILNLVNFIIFIKIL
jgi:hypothetical protein